MQESHCSDKFLTTYKYQFATEISLSTAIGRQFDRAFYMVFSSHIVNSYTYIHLHKTKLTSNTVDESLFGVGIFSQLSSTLMAHYSY